VWESDWKHRQRSHLMFLEDESGSGVEGALEQAH
jgi:hypothetical protein